MVTPELADLDDQFAELRRLLRVEAGRRLVEQQQLRLRCQRPCELDATLQPIGQAARRRLRQIAKTNGVKNSRVARRVRLPPLPARACGSARSEAQKPFFMRQCCPSKTFSSTDRLANRRRFWKVRPMPMRQIAWLSGPPISCPMKRDAPELGVRTPRDHVDHRALAGAIRADQRMHMAMLQPEGDIFAGRTPPKFFDTSATSSRGLERSSLRWSAPSSVASASPAQVRSPTSCEETTEQARHTIRHDVKREEQEATVCEVLDRRPSRKQGINKRQRYRADQRPVQRPGTAEEHQQQDEDRQVEADKVGVHVLVLLRDHRAGYAAGYGRDDEGQDLVAIDANADGFCRDLVRLQARERPGRNARTAGSAEAGA